MLYHPSHFDAFYNRNGLTQETFCKSVKGRDLPTVQFGEGNKWILLTARHHACEATGNYVMEGVIETLLTALPQGYAVLVVPFVDYDGVVDGMGKISQESMRELDVHSAEELSATLPITKAIFDPPNCSLTERIRQIGQAKSTHTFRRLV